LIDRPRSAEAAADGDRTPGGRHHATDVHQPSDDVANVATSSSFEHPKTSIGSD